MRSASSFDWLANSRALFNRKSLNWRNARSDATFKALEESALVRFVKRAPLNSEVSRRALGERFDAVVEVLNRAVSQDVGFGWDERFEFELA